MTDVFSSPKGMLGRANRQIEQLDTEINVFMKEKKRSFVVEKDVETGELVHKIKFTAMLSEDLPHIVFEAANNIRSTLDQMGFAIAVAHTGDAAPKSCKFPLGPTEADMRNNAKGGCKDLPPEITALFVSFKPYKGGNNILWSLNELANTPKHKLLFPVGVMGLGHNVSYFTGGGPGQTLKFDLPRFKREKNEIEFLRTSENAKVNYNLNLAFTVALDDVDEMIAGQHPVHVLSVMAREVAEVLNRTETACRRIGLIK